MIFSENNGFESTVMAILKSNIEAITNYGADHIGYRYFLANGKSFGLTTNPKWYTTKKTVEFFENQKKHFETELFFLINSGSSYVTRSVYQSENDYLKELNDRDMCNSVGIYRFTPHKIEHFFFISRSKENEKKDLMLNNLANLEAIVKIIANQINLAAENHAIHPDPEFVLSKSITTALFSKIVDNHNRKHNIRFRGAEIKLTQRELDVLTLLERNYSNRIIADNLNVSVRTIDSYVSNLKVKFKCNRASLNTLLKNGQIKYFNKNKVA